MTSTTTGRRLGANGTQLYAEVRGSGPALLLITGAAGDAGQYAEIADELAPSFSVITYDRRSNSRSPRSPGWESTTVEEQADDAIGLLHALDVPSATVFGNSIGAVIALAVALRAPQLVERVVLHEPTLMAVLADPEAAMSSVQPVIAQGMEQGGLSGGMEAFLRFAAAAGYDRLTENVRARMIDNAEVLFQAEFGPLMSWSPDEAALANCEVPAAVLTAAETAPFFREAAGWVAQRLSATVGTTPGGHMGFLTDPAEFANVLTRAVAG